MWQDQKAVVFWSNLNYKPVPRGGKTPRYWYEMVNKRFMNISRLINEITQKLFWNNHYHLILGQRYSRVLLRKIQQLSSFWLNEKERFNQAPSVLDEQLCFMQITDTKSQVGLKYENKRGLLARIRKPLIWKCLVYPISPPGWTLKWSMMGIFKWATAKVSRACQARAFFCRVLCMPLGMREKGADSFLC